MWLTTLHAHPEPLLPWSVAIGASLVAALTDVRARRIPNVLTFPLALSGWIASTIAFGTAGLADSLAATFVLAAPFVLLFAFAGGGAGDAKLMGGIGAWLGVVDGFVTLLAVCLAGMVLGVAFAAARRRLGSVLSNLRSAALGLLQSVFGGGKLAHARRDVARALPTVDDGQKMPYALAISAGTVLAAGASWIWRTRNV
jgi:prepilin peptidase CpaA